MFGVEGFVALLLACTGPHGPVLVTGPAMGKGERPAAAQGVARWTAAASSAVCDQGVGSSKEPL